MALDPIQKTAADVLAVRILLGQLIVRIAAGSQDPKAVLKIMNDSAAQTAERAKLRDLPDDLQAEVRTYLRSSIERFFAAMRIEKGPAPGDQPEPPQKS